MLKELFVPYLDLQFCVQVFGKQTDPAVVLIAGAASQSILWNKTLCANISKAGYFVIRFDYRDTGLSSSINFEEKPYNLIDMAKDILGILDYFEVKKAHYVGMSMGGFISQFTAIYFPERILTLTLFMTTINSLPMRGIRGSHNLPPQDPFVVKQLAELYQSPRANLDDKLKNLVTSWQLYNGLKADFNYDEWYILAEEAYTRAKARNAVRNHRLAILNSPADRTKLLQSSKIPSTLIIHGAADPIIKIAHAYYAHTHLPESKLLVIEKLGHLLTSEFTNQIEDELLNHFQSKI